MRRALTLSLAHPALVIALTAAFAVVGTIAFWHLPIEAFPELADPQVQVITLFPGHAAEEVERQVTLAIEREMNGLPGLTRMHSFSLLGLSYVALTFEDGTDLYFARQQVSERLAQVDVPDGVKPTLGPLSTPSGEIYRYTLVGDAYSPMQLREIEDWVMERYLKQVPGVADVVSFGGFVKQYQVQVDPQQLEAHAVTLRQVFDALARSNANAGGNYIEHGEEQYIVRGLGTLGRAEDIEEVVVAARGGTPIRIRDVARVAVGAAPRRGIVTRDREPEAVEGIVLMRRGEDPSTVLAALRAKVDQLNHGILPAGVHIDTFYDRSHLVRRTLVTVTHNLVVGALLVVLVVGVFLMSVRAAAVVALVIPLSLLGAFLYLKLRGMSANLLSLGAVDFGIMVDGAVIMVEHLARRLTAVAAPSERRSAVHEAACEVARPTVFALSIIIVAYLPIFTLQRVEGRIFAPMANTVCAALVAALVFSFTLVPVLAFLVLKGTPGRAETPIEIAALRVYRPMLRWALAHGRAVVATTALVLAFGVWRSTRLGTEFLPELNEGALYVTATLPPSVALSQAARVVLPRIRETFLAFPEVQGILGQLGSPEDGTDWKTANNLEYFVDLKPREEWPPGMTTDRLIADMQARLADLPGVDFNFSQPIKDNIEENISGLKGQLAVKLFGDDLDTLHRTAAEVKRVLEGVPGVADLAVTQADELPQVHIVVDREAVARYGLNIADVEDVVETAIGGKAATTLWEGERHFDVVVRLEEASRASLDRIPDIRVATPDGAQVPLAQLARVTVAPGQSSITREANQRFVGIKCNVRGRDFGGFVAEAQRRVAAEVTLPPNFFLTWGGEFENQRRAMARLAIIIPVSIVLILAILVRTFGSLGCALLILATIPFALVGGVVGLDLTGLNLSVAACIGFIALMGQVVLNGVVLVSQINSLRAEGLGVRAAVEAGATRRLRAVLMTALLAALGLLPAALSTQIGSETQRPLAVVVIGGLVSATVLTLLVLPVLYVLVFRERTERSQLRILLRMPRSVPGADVA
ncbi:MAG TPA: CusA/CzcA family heavy metal efflux RND transporter [Candidatus Nitrosopolaris sp.]|nr:CusA/CzcA family heavy metal efflux RND transporter [Candidatus Nitrosopolaris sp.]